MRRYFGWALAAVVSLTVMGLGTASAADMAMKARPAPLPVPVANWTGCYLGAGGGYGLFAVEHQGIGIAGQAAFDPKSTGGRGGFGTVGAGCDYQFAASNWVIGAFGDYDWMDLRGNHDWDCITANGCTYNGGAGSTAQATHGLREKSAWAVGARIGYVVSPQVLAYVNGGYTQTNFGQVSIFQPGIGATPPNDTGAVLLAQTFSGYFLGGGTEVAIGWLPGLFWKSEYRFAHYDTRNAPMVCLALAPAGGSGCAAVGATGVSDRMQPVVQTVRTELVWRFNWSGR